MMSRTRTRNMLSKMATNMDAAHCWSSDISAIGLAERPTTEISLFVRSRTSASTTWAARFLPFFAEVGMVRRFRRKGWPDTTCIVHDVTEGRKEEWESLALFTQILSLSLSLLIHNKKYRKKRKWKPNRVKFVRSIKNRNKKRKRNRNRNRNGARNRNRNRNRNRKGSSSRRRKKKNHQTNSKI